MSHTRIALGLGLVMGLVSAANATTTTTVDDFTVNQGPVSDLTTGNGPVVNTLPSREISVDLLNSELPVNNSVQVVAGVLDITNGTGEDSHIIISIPIAANLLPNASIQVNFQLDVVASDGNPTQIQVFLNGLAPANQLGVTAFVPGNTFNDEFVFGPITLPEIAAIQNGGILHLVLDGAPGWDATFDRFSFSHELPEPASMGLAFMGLAGLAIRRRRS